LDRIRKFLRLAARLCYVTKRYDATLHMISVEELPDFPASIGEIVEVKGAETHKFHDVLERAHAMAKAEGVNIDLQVVAGHAASAIVERVKAFNSDLLVLCSWVTRPFMNGLLVEPRIGSFVSRLVLYWSSNEVL
jgi:nucleotide-binding universal stress UspA family protein